jgi:hypothetical protein
MLDSIDRFVAEALSKNIALTLVNHPQGVHGFDTRPADGWLGAGLTRSIVHVRHVMF